MHTFEYIANLGYSEQLNILKNNGLTASRDQYTNEVAIAHLYHSQGKLDLIDSAYLGVAEFDDLYTLGNEELVRMGNDVGFVFPMVPRSVDVHAILVRGVIYNLLLKKGTPLYLGPMPVTI